MVTLLSSATAVPDVCLTASDTKSFFSRYLPPRLVARFGRIVDSSKNASRYSVMPFERLAALQTLDDRSTAYARHAVPLAEAVARKALAAARVDPRSISALVCVSATGYVMPSLDTYLVNRLSLDPHCRRVPMNQLGCGGGVSALGLAAELLHGSASARALVVSVELPSLCLQLAEPSLNDLLASTQFGDGAAAAVLSAGEPAAGLEILATRSALFPHTIDLDGIRLTSTGLRPVPRRGFPRLVHRHVPSMLDDLLASQSMSKKDVTFWAVHGRSPQVLQAMAECLELNDTDLEAARRVWERHGNMLSATVFFVLEQLEAMTTPAPGSNGLMLAFGAGASCEMVLLRAPVAA